MREWRHKSPNLGEMIAAEFDNNIDYLNWMVAKEKEAAWGVFKDLKQRDEDWSGVKDWEQVKNKLAYGDDEFTGYFCDNLKDLSEDGDARNGVWMDIEGFSYDMGSVVAGEPECCVNMNGPESKPELVVYVPISFSCDWNKNLLLNRGVAITNLIHTLMVKGYILDIKMFHSVKREYKGEKGCNRITYVVNIPTQNLCIADIAYSCSPAYFRGAHFVAMDMLADHFSGENGDGRGRGEKCKQIVNEVKSKGIYFPDGYDGEGKRNFETVEKANEWAIKRFNEYVERRNAGLKAKDEKMASITYDEDDEDDIPF